MKEKMIEASCTTFEAHCRENARLHGFDDWNEVTDRDEAGYTSHNIPLDWWGWQFTLAHLIDKIYIR